MSCDLEELDLISAVWILASHDENHLITYEGIRERLGLKPDFNVKSLVSQRRELFRPGAPSRELEEWKVAMRERRRLPSWIKLISDETVRSSKIEGFSNGDVFRSQFRISQGAPRSDVPIVTWGLEHIDRLRKSKIVSREASAKSWQMWLVFVVGVCNIFATVVVGSLKGCESGQSKPVTIASQPIIPPNMMRQAVELKR